MKNTSNSPIFSGFILGAVIFLSVILLSYTMVFATTLPDTPLWLRVTLTLLLVSLFYILFVASVRAGRDRPGLRRTKIIASFLAMYLVSGYGFSAAYMLFFQGPNILREHVGVAIDSFARLKAVAERDLPIPEYEQVVARVRSSESGLIREINSPSGKNYCGVGPNAMRYIREISQDLKGFTLISGTTSQHNCDDVLLMERIADSYRQDINQRLENHPILAQRGAVVRQKTLGDIQVTTRAQTEELNKYGESLAGIANLLFRFWLFAEVAGKLQHAANDYSALLQSLAAVSKTSILAIPRAVDLSSLHRVLSAQEMPWVMLERINHIATWGGLALPFIFDLGGVAYSRRVLERYRQIRRRAQAVYVGNSDVRYLLAATQT